MQNLAQTVLERLEAEPERGALVEASGRRWSRGELALAIQVLHQRLEELGLQPGQRVVLQVPQGPALVAGTLAAIAMGAVPVLLEGGLGDALYLERIAAAGPEALVVHPALQVLHALPLRPLLRPLGLPPLPPIPRQMGLSDRSLRDWMRGVSIRTVAPHPLPDSHPCIIVYTGGTTQAPKAVQHSHGSLRAFLGAIDHLDGIGDLERMAVDTLPQALYALHLGMEAHLAAGRGPRRARQVLACLQSGAAQGYFGAPYLWREMMRLAPGLRLPPSLRLVLLGSAPVRPAFLRQLHGALHPLTRVTSLYGMTEAGPICAASLAEKLDWTGTGDLVGRPLPGIQVEVDAVPGEVGEVLLRGPSLCPGYLGQAPRDPDDPLRTGDLGQWTEVGGRPALVLHGRRKEMIIRRGLNLYPGTLEGPILQECLRRGLPVEDCALVGQWEESRQDEALHLVVAGPPHLDLVALAAAARAAAGPDGDPDQLHRLEALPVKGRQNKRDLAALRALIGPSAPPASALLPYGASDLLLRTRLRLGAGSGGLRVLGEFGLRLGLWGLSQATWTLDALLAPDWSAARGRGPLFIIGHQRSGTTALHRLLAADTAHARALTLAEMLLPAVTAAPLREAFARADRVLGSPLARLQERLLSPMDPLHRIRLGEVEEDEFVLWSVFASIMVANDDPWLVEHRHLDHLRHFERWAPERQEQVLAFYRDVLRKRLYRDRQTPPDARWIVAKNPAFSQKIPALARLFPEARFVYLLRHPLQAIRSRLSLLREIWRRRFPQSPCLSPAQTEVILEDSLRTYLCAERDLPQLPPERRLTLLHADLHRDPQAALERIYAHFQLPGPAPLAPSPPPARALSADDIRFDEARVRQELAALLDRHGFV